MTGWRMIAIVCIVVPVTMFVALLAIGDYGAACFYLSGGFGSLTVAGAWRYLRDD